MKSLFTQTLTSSKWVQLKWGGGARNLLTKLSVKDKEWPGSQKKTDAGEAAQLQVTEK